FSDSVGRRCCVLQWHPDMATQVIVASDDDSSPSLRVWDMRNTMFPLWELVGHTKGTMVLLQCPGVQMIAPICLLAPKTIALYVGTLIQLRSVIAVFG
ncbi:transport protein Sec31 homolog B-like protein isoform X1, partial [Tanacetum coccineum]